MKSTCLLAAALAGAVALLQAPAASAVDILVKCEKRDTRSKISVDAGGLPGGDYRARVLSGDNRRLSPAQVPVGAEVEFDFDSKQADIAAGATSIPRDFIQNGTVTGKIINAAGRTVISDTVQCRMR